MKAKHLAILVLITGIFTISILSSCRFNCVHGSGNQISETRKMGDFSRISISGGFKVVLKQDSSMVLKITADDNILKYIKTEVEDGRLEVYSKRSLCNSGE